MGIKEDLKNIYRAIDCMDISDIKIALNECTKLVKKYGFRATGAGAIYRRICALHRRGDKLHGDTTWANFL